MQHSKHHDAGRAARPTFGHSKTGSPVLINWKSIGFTTDLSNINHPACSIPEENCTLLMNAKPQRSLAWSRSRKWGRWCLHRHGAHVTLRTPLRSPALIQLPTFVRSEVVPNGVHQVFHIHFHLARISWHSDLPKGWGCLLWRNCGSN